MHTNLKVLFPTVPEPATVPVHTLTLTRLRRDHPASLVLWPQTLARIQAMSARLGGSPDFMHQHLWTLYAADSPLLGVWAAQRGEMLVGHALGLIEHWQGRPVAWVNQVDMDEPAPKAFKDLFLAELTAWVREANESLAKQGLQVKEFLMQSHRMTDAWARHAGFDVHRVIFKREVKP